MGKTENKASKTPSRGVNISSLRGKTAAPQWEAPAPPAPTNGPMEEEQIVEYAKQIAPAETVIEERSAALRALYDQGLYDDQFSFPANDKFLEIFRFRQWITLVRATDGRYETVKMRDIPEAEKAMENWKRPAATRRLRRK
jgi:hypothetical protein